MAKNKTVKIKLKHVAQNLYRAVRRSSIFCIYMYTLVFNFMLNVLLMFHTSN